MLVERFLIIGLNHVIEWLLGYRYISGVYTDGYRRSRLLLSMGAANILLLISFSDNVAVNILINYLIISVAVLISTGRGVISVIFNVFLFEFMIIAAESLSLFVIRNSGIDISTEDMTYAQLFASTVIDKLILVVLIETLLFLRRKEATDDRRYGPANYVIISASVISVLILLCLLVVMTEENIERDDANLLTVSAALIMGLNAMIYILNAVIARENRKQSQIEMDIQRGRDLDNYIKLLEQKTNDERILIHDVKHHLSVLKELIGKGETAEAGAYLESVTGGRDLHSGFKYTNNWVFNLILARYDRACKEKGIELYIDAQNSRLGFMDHADITSLFCNLMDNAMEAAGISEQPLVHLKVDHIDSKRLTLVSVNNSCVGEPKKEANGDLITSKSKGGLHGTGQRSIQKIIDRYNGSYSTRSDAEMGEFITNIILRENSDR